ncbi:MAG: hypothetical protein KF756_12110 [Acidobacteria bacterium]|nr:hypothetical protein [Acidobacteriota bacterium]
MRIILGMMLVLGCGAGILFGSEAGSRVLTGARPMPTPPANILENSNSNGNANWHSNMNMNVNADANSDAEPSNTFR